VQTNTDSHTNTPSLPARKPGLLINRNFALLWIGQAISFTGDFVFDTVLILWVTTQIARGQTWTPLAVSGVVLAGALPSLLVSPVAGVFIDRWHDKRKTMLWMYVLSMICVLLLFSLTWLQSLPFSLPLWEELGAIYACTLVVGTLAQFFNPAEMALLSDIVAEPYRARATSLHTLTLNIAALLGPALAALLYFALGVQWALLLNALSFAVAFCTILAIRVPAQVSSISENVSGRREDRARASLAPTLTSSDINDDIEGRGEACPRPGTHGTCPRPEKRVDTRTATRERGKRTHFLHDVVEGLCFLSATRILVTLLVTGVLLEFGGAMRNTLNIFFLTQNLHASASLYGLLSAAIGAGLIVGAALTMLLARKIGLTRTYCLSVIVYGILDLIYARMTSFAPAILMLLLQGLVNGMTETLMITLVIQVAPRDFVGRVLSVFTSLYGLAYICATMLAGYLDSTLLRHFHAVVLHITFGPIDSMIASIGIIAIIGGVYAIGTLWNAQMVAKGPIDRVQSGYPN
jgi:MFS family permease